MEEPAAPADAPAATRPRAIGALVVAVADVSGTFLFAVQSGFAATRAGFDPIGVLALAFAGSLGGGVMRDLLLRLRPAAIADWRYTAIVLVAASAAWVIGAPVGARMEWAITALDAAALALFAVAGVEKALDHDIHPLPAIFVGTIGAVGGGVIRDVLLNRTPRILDTDIYATAAILAAAIVVAGRILGINPRATAIVAGAACLALRIAAVAHGWQLPHPAR